MLGVVARIKVKPGQEDAFLRAIGALRDAVKAQEPDTVTYDCFRSRTNPQEFVMLEVYRSQAALDAHQKAPHFLAAGAALMPTFDGMPAIEIFDGV
ncbi:MAG: putative quinol monooxygenase [Caulobacterales bacterium]